MQKLIFRNSLGKEIDFTSGNYGINNWNGFSEVGMEIQTQKVPFQDGSVYLDNLLNERELSITLSYNDNKDLQKRYELRRELISILNPKLGEGILIYKNNFIEKQINVIANMPVFANKNADEGGTNKADISFVANSPYWEDLKETENYIGEPEGQAVGSLYAGMLENNGDIKTECHIIFNSESAGVVEIENKKSENKIIFNTEENKTYFVNTELGKKAVFSLDLTSTDGQIVAYHQYYSEELDKYIVILMNKDGATSFTQYKYYYSIRNGSDITSGGGQYSLDFTSNGNKPAPDMKVYSITIGLDIYTIIGFNMFKNGINYMECGNCDFIKIKDRYYCVSDSPHQYLIDVLTKEQVQLNGDGKTYQLARAVIYKDDKAILIEEGNISDCTYKVIDSSFNISSGVMGGNGNVPIIDAITHEESGKILIRTRTYNYFTEDFITFEMLPFTTSDYDNHPVAKTVLYNKASKMYVVMSANVTGLESGIKVTKDFRFFVSHRIGTYEQLNPNYATCMTQNKNNVYFSSGSYNDGVSGKGANGTMTINRKNEIDKLLSNLTFNIEGGMNLVKANVPVSISYKNKFVGV
ncbi:MAG: phage tail family protein [Treponema sp.]|nr:phage tail family protein [Treponema sp.]